MAKKRAKRREKLQRRLERQQKRHAELAQQVDDHNGPSAGLEQTRLKKQKLQVKDEIAWLENQLRAEGAIAAE